MYTNSALAPPPRAPRASAYGVALDPEPRVERAVARRPARRRASHVESVPRGRRARDGAIARFDGAVRRAATRVASRTGVAGAPASVRDARCRASRVG